MWDTIPQISATPLEVKGGEVYVGIIPTKRKHHIHDAHLRPIPAIPLHRVVATFRTRRLDEPGLVLPAGDVRALRPVRSRKRVASVNATATSSDPAKKHGARGARARGEHAASSVPRRVGYALLIAAGFAIAWLLVAAEATREREAGCHQRSYRDPVTGRQMERSCRMT